MEVALHPSWMKGENDSRQKREGDEVEEEKREKERQRVIPWVNLLIKTFLS